MLDESWGLSPAVALRPEPFGAMAYHFGNRKLTFLKRMQLVEVVRGLAEHPDVRSTLVAAEVPEQDWPGYLSALRGLAETDMIRPRVEVEEDAA
ncbi:mycofactocin biosynthesis chaperone MftB [Aeromicrobium fastidiosum]|uniref:Mycofactocin biosynthesis chaperone MftB n=1 Tax=Aeromicrobium fastidiosum TaxID=52699 RepID=A0A641APR9_9ACTN|nr:mycofactocin biosynthesis chaperone MftB [Aeromicrobium fastidiosum]KAA1379935.1 mycofactocin biosynthesis chaperone MftB [Aeromicrobium fastidiosum]MBP2389442.1 putative mycofactocin binding protein MftB [Aeromicrobium fastidiosum]